MSVNETSTTAKFNDGEAAEDVGRFSKKTIERFHQIAVGARRAAQIGIALATTFGTAIDQSLAMSIEAGLLAVELFTAQAAGTLGITSIFQGAAIISLLATVVQLEAGRTENARRTAGLVSAFRLLSFR